MPKSSALVLTLAIILLVGAGCSPSKETQPTSEKKEVGTGANQPKNPDAEAKKDLPTAKAEVKIKPADENKSVTTPPVAPPAPIKVKEFTMTAKNWDFEPSTISVKKGDTVRLHIKSVDVDHGFTLAAFGVSTKLKPGATETVEFTADKVGNHSFFCSVFCGAGHKEMRGTLTVTE